ncbi:MAG TPA: sulfurase [Verrucomicrobiales bacterium]|nr:sulfurase [Verrucomicrobiales bacterium]
MSHLVDILIFAAPGSPAEHRTRTRAIPGRGLEGDRYFLGSGTFSPTPQKPDFELTLIQEEHVADFARATGIPFTAEEARRNLVTRGIDLNSLVGREFMIGPVRARGHRLCEPCNHLAKLTRPEVLRGLLHKGGLRAQILTEGEISLGDSLVPCNPTPSLE